MINSITRCAFCERYIHNIKIPNDAKYNYFEYKINNGIPIFICNECNNSHQMIKNNIVLLSKNTVFAENMRMISRKNIIFSFKNYEDRRLIVSTFKTRFGINFSFSMIYEDGKAVATCRHCESKPVKMIFDSNISGNILACKKHLYMCKMA